MNLIRFLFVDNYYYHSDRTFQEIYSKPIMQLMAVRPANGSAVRLNHAIRCSVCIEG